MEPLQTKAETLSVRDAREAAGLTPGQLAVALGVRERTVERWEAGTMTPRPAMAAALSEALGLAVEGEVA